jgi:nitroreductase
MPDLLKVMQARHSERGSFDSSRPVPRQHLELILESARWAPTPHNMQNFEILVVDDQDRLSAIQKFRSDATEAFLRENYAQLSFSEQELLEKKTGLLASMFPPAWTTPEAWREDSDYRSQLAFVDTWMRETPLLLIVLRDAGKRAPGSEGDVLGNVGLGCVMENMWLMSECLGVGFQALSAFSNDHVERKVRSLLGVPDGMEISFGCRLGYPLESVPAVRVRRNLDDFCHHNTFGRKDLLLHESESLPTLEHDLDLSETRTISLRLENNMSERPHNPYAELHTLSAHEITRKAHEHSVSAHRHQEESATEISPAHETKDN